MKTFLAVLLALALPAVLVADDEPAVRKSDRQARQLRRFELADVAKLVNLSDPQIAPDGRSIVVVVTRSDYGKNKLVSDLVLVDVATGHQRVLTFEREDVDQPRWSPSGDRLAFLAHADPDRDGKQIFILPMNGGDARRITNVANGVQQYAWRPNGLDIAFVTADEAEKKGSDDAFEVGDNDYLATAAPMPEHIWLVEAAGGKPRRLTSGSWTLATSPPPGPPPPPISWSPDGQFIAFVRQARPQFGDSDLTAIQILNVDSGTVRSLTHRSKFENFPAYSPDGTQLSYWYPRDGDSNNINEIWVAAAVSGGKTSHPAAEGRCPTRGLDRCLYLSTWMPDGKSLLVGGNDGTRVALWIQPLDGPARRLDLGRVNPTWEFALDATVARNGAIAFTGSEALRPTELYYLASATATPRRLTDFNQEVASYDLGKVEAIEWQGPDGFREDGILTYPPDFEPSRKYPLVLNIHGGPNTTSCAVFSDLSQLLAARGYVVFEPNYRGSDNRGNAYQRAIVNDAGAGPARDVMAGVEAVQKRGFIDPGRMAVSGWSYGGFMTVWLTGHYQVWKAAVAGAAVTDHIDQYNLSDANVQERYSFGGSPWVGRNARAYREQSPITYAAQIRTPTLILSTTGDVRVPVTQSYRLFHALRDNGVEAKFIAYPVSGHYPSDPVRSRDVYKRWLGWLDDHLRPAATTARK
jgi:dipeptidyl aminopeptidase/acylaminoacyl peptidase